MWIKVSDALPTKGKVMSYEKYIVSNGGNGFSCNFMNGKWYTDFSGSGPRGDITHWMPFPTRPVE